MRGRGWRDSSLPTLQVTHMRAGYFRVLAACLIIAGVLTDALPGTAMDKPGLFGFPPPEGGCGAIPNGQGARPHSHPNARYVTVLEGTWYTGTGDTFDVARAVPLKPGSVMMHPANAVHWDGSAGPETVIVQIIGNGPAKTTPADPAKPFWLELPH